MAAHCGPASWAPPAFSHHWGPLFARTRSRAHFVLGGVVVCGLARAQVAGCLARADTGRDFSVGARSAFAPDPARGGRCGCRSGIRGVAFHGSDEPFRAPLTWRCTRWSPGLRSGSSNRRRSAPTGERQVVSGDVGVVASDSRTLGRFLVRCCFNACRRTAPGVFRAPVARRSGSTVVCTDSLQSAFCSTPGCRFESCESPGCPVSCESRPPSGLQRR